MLTDTDGASHDFWFLHFCTSFHMICLFKFFGVRKILSVSWNVMSVDF